MPLSFAPPTDTAIPIRLVDKSEATDLLPVCRNLPRHGPGITALPETSGNPAPFPAPMDGPPWF
jgi:hypothetical protein